MKGLGAEQNPEESSLLRIDIIEHDVEYYVSS